MCDFATILEGSPNRATADDVERQMMRACQNDYLQESGFLVVSLSQNVHVSTCLDPDTSENGEDFDTSTVVETGSNVGKWCILTKGELLRHQGKKYPSV